MLDELGLEDQMEVRRLEPDKGAQQVQGLDAVLLLDEERVERKEERLG